MLIDLSESVRIIDIFVLGLSNSKYIKEELVVEKSPLVGWLWADLAVNT